MKERNWFHVLLLSVLTCGIYNTYVWYCEFAELYVIEEKQGQVAIPYWLFLILDILSGSLFGFVLMALYRKRAVEVLDSCQVKTRLRSPIIYSLLMYLPIISFYIHETQHNKLIRLYNERLNVDSNNIYTEFSVN